VDFYEIPPLFGIDGAAEIVPVGSGHINTTLRVNAYEGEYILQSLNRNVFRDPTAVMDNISAVQRAFPGTDDRIGIPEYLTCKGRNFAEYGGEVWRMYRFVRQEGSPDEHLAGLAFGSFIRRVSGIRTVRTVDGYHDFDRYISRLGTLDCDEVPELCGELFRLGETLSEVFAPLPKRVIHGDAKLGNVITGEKCTVIDLDTVMEGYPAVDFGDLVRSLGTSDAERINAAAEGFAEGLDGLLSSAEADSLYYGILWTTGELAARYLIDYITSEGYFSGKTQEQRLGRARELAGQLRTFRNMETELKDIIRSIWR